MPSSCSIPSHEPAHLLLINLQYLPRNTTSLACFRLLRKSRRSLYLKEQKGGTPFFSLPLFLIDDVLLERSGKGSWLTTRRKRSRQCTFQDGRPAAWTTARRYRTKHSEPQDLCERTKQRAPGVEALSLLSLTFCFPFYFSKYRFWQLYWTFTLRKKNVREFWLVEKKREIKRGASTNIFMCIEKILYVRVFLSFKSWVEVHFFYFIIN